MNDGDYIYYMPKIVTLALMLYAFVWLSEGLEKNRTINMGIFFQKWVFICIHVCLSYCAFDSYFVFVCAITRAYIYTYICNYTGINPYICTHTSAVRWWEGVRQRKKACVGKSRGEGGGKWIVVIRMICFFLSILSNFSMATVLFVVIWNICFEVKFVEWHNA